MKVRYDDSKFTDEEGDEHFFFNELPEWVWKHMVVISTIKDAYPYAWAAYKVGCPYGPCEADTVISVLKSSHGLSQEAAEYVAHKVYPFRNRPKEAFGEWLYEQ